MIATITGANGFIGQHLVRRFGEAGWETRPIVRRDFELGDRHLERACDGADVVVHAAAATRAPTRRALHASNVELTARILAASMRGSTGRFVFISSQAAAGPSTSRDAPLDEGAEPAPMEAYGRSKLEAEGLVRAEANGLPFVILRPSAVYGPGDRDFLAMFRLAKRGVAIHPGTRDQWISIAHVDDVASAVILAATESGAVGGTFFVANDESVQWGQLFRDCAAAANRGLRVDIQVPSAVVSLGARAGDVVARITGRAGLLTSEKVALGRPRSWTCSNERAKRDLGWRPSVRLQDGLRETYHWYLTHDWL